MLVFVSLINKKSINTHIVEVLHIVGTSVKHLFGLYLCILLGYLLLLQLCCGILALGSHVAGDVCKLLLQVLDFFLGLSGYHAVATLVCILHLLQDKKLLLDFVIDEAYLSLLAVRNKLKG